MPRHYINNTFSHAFERGNLSETLCVLHFFLGESHPKPCILYALKVFFALLRRALCCCFVLFSCYFVSMTTTEIAFAETTARTVGATGATGATGENTQETPEEKAAKEAARLAEYYEMLSRIKILETENHALFTEEVAQFVKISHVNPLYYEVQMQLPAEAYLLDVFVPASYDQDLRRDYHGNITRMVYLYTMPTILEESERTQRMQLSFVKKSLISILNFYEPLASLKSDKAEEKLAWEERVYTRLMRGQSIHFRYPSHKAKNGEDEILSMMQTFPLESTRSIGTKSSEGDDGTGEKYTGAFLSTYIFERNRQIYFLSASSFITGNEYYEELMWTRDTVEKFISKIIPRPITRR